MHAPMLREHETVPASPEPDNAKDLPGGAAVGRLGAAIGMPAAAKKAASRRSLDFQGNNGGEVVSCEIQGEGAGASQAHLVGQRGLKHRKEARDSANVTEEVRLVDSDEEAVTERVLRYLSHHLLARVETDGGRTREGLGHSSGLDRQQEQEEAAGACSSLAAGLLGIDGLMFLIEAGVDVDEDVVCSRVCVCVCVCVCVSARMSDTHMPYMHTGTSDCRGQHRRRSGACLAEGARKPLEYVGGAG